MTATYPFSLLFLLSLLLPNSKAHAHVVWQADFVGQDWLKSFNNPPWTEGLERTQRVWDVERKKMVLEVSYPKAAWGNEHSGAQWPCYLEKKLERAKLSYWLKLSKDFPFVKGGKLPGLIGGHRKGHPHSNLTGGHKPDGSDGWSARVMWRKAGQLVQYVYHKDQPKKWGQDFPWRSGGKPVSLKTEHWHHIANEITMNSVGKKDGRIQAWLDGQLVLDQSGFEFRTVPDLKIDALYFSTFFGGDDASWAPAQTASIRFDSFEIDVQ